MRTDPRIAGSGAASGPVRPRWRRLDNGLTPVSRVAVLLAAGLAAALAGCTLGPDYQKPEVQVPQSFKEGVDWQRAEANPSAAISSTWWKMYQDPVLDDLVDRSVKANLSIAAAEAAYRVALATVEANTASLFPVVSASLAASRTGIGSGVTSSGLSSSAAGSAGALGAGVHNSVSATASASWEIDLWGSIRRQIESAKESAQASDAQLAGERISIEASVVVDYFALRQADYDIQSLSKQQEIDNRLLDMVQQAYRQGAASSDQVLVAQDDLETIVAELQTTRITREQDEHALAVLAGVPPQGFTIPPDPGHEFLIPDIPLSLPSQLLERRYDVVSAERTAAAANARIGVAEAAFFPDLTLTAEGGFQHNTFAHLFSLPNRLWTLGPTLAETVFDAGSRTAAVRQAQATYDEDVALYRNTVLTAFSSVEDSLSSVNHLRTQEESFANILHRNQQLFSSMRAQRDAGAASEQDLLNQQLTLVEAEQSLRDTQSVLAQSTVTLVKNLGGGWQWDDDKASSAAGHPFSSTGYGSLESQAREQDAGTPPNPTNATNTTNTTNAPATPQPHN
ncbi:Efflux transporter outer membrane subunit [Pararobbsia alpina]|uniref:efflux transporter outer membrane subunit n=1 Tax=Pararobbsia alpina TaxID=621374 RepID=UPI0039A57C66